MTAVESLATTALHFNIPELLVHNLLSVTSYHSVATVALLRKARNMTSIAEYIVVRLHSRDAIDNVAERAIHIEF